MASTGFAISNICRASIAQASTLGIQRAIIGPAVSVLSRTRPNPLQNTAPMSPRRFFSSTPNFQPSISMHTTTMRHSLLSNSALPSISTSTLGTRTFYSLTRPDAKCTYTTDKAAAKRKALRNARAQLKEYLREKLCSYHIYQIEHAFSDYATAKSIKQSIRLMQEEDVDRAELKKVLTRSRYSMHLFYFIVSCCVFGGPVKLCLEAWGWGRKEDANIGSGQTRKAALDCSDAKE